MLSNECERDIQLELNRNYLKSFPARLKFCHIILGVLSIGSLSSVSVNCAWNRYSNTCTYIWLTLVPMLISIMLTLFSLIFLVSCTINWKTSGRIRMARINFIFHTVAIILLNMSTTVLLIGILVCYVNNYYSREQMHLFVAVVCASVCNVLNCLLYFLSIKQVRTTCENY